jgi:hypothetical protein
MGPKNTDSFVPNSLIQRSANNVTVLEISALLMEELVVREIFVGVPSLA